MSRLPERFAALRARGERGLVAYLTCGDPSLEATEALALEAAARGADVLELGIPFSDPSADGPAIQAAMGRALRAGTTLRRVLGLVERLRRRTDVPIVLFGYYNPLLAYGVERVARDAAAAGADAFLVVDLPPEEADELAGPAHAAGLDLVPLLAPTSTPARIAQAARLATGFLYYVALAGVTGAALGDVEAVVERVRALRPQLGAIPLAVGFGVATPDAARRLGSVADAVVVGSALIRAAERAGADAPRVVGELVAGLKAALRG